MASTSSCTAEASASVRFVTLAGVVPADGPSDVADDERPVVVESAGVEAAAVEVAEPTEPDGPATNASNGTRTAGPRWLCGLCGLCAATSGVGGAIDICVPFPVGRSEPPRTGPALPVARGPGGPPQRLQ